MAETKKISDIQKFTDTLAKYEESIARVLGDKHITPDEFIMSVINVVKGNPKLLQVEARSLFAAIFMAAELQLRVSAPDNPEGLCYISAIKNKAKFLCGYKGLLEIAYRSSKVKTIVAEPVYANEFYVQSENDYKFIKYTGMAINELQLIKAQKDFLKDSGFTGSEIEVFIEEYKKGLKNGKGELKLVYAACQVEGLDKPIFKSVTLDVLKKLEGLSPSTKGDNAHYSPYNNMTDINDMMRVKAAIKLLFKFLPKQHLDTRMAKAIEYDDASMAGKIPILGEGNEVKMVDAKEADAEEKTKKYAAHFGADVDFEDTAFVESGDVTPPPPVEKTAEPDKKEDKKESKKK